MLLHSDVWRAIDLLARDCGLSTSGLARQAGLDPTSFNKSKRITRSGKARWPSTESIAKILSSTGTTLYQFTAYFGGSSNSEVKCEIPIIGFTQVSSPVFFNKSGHPIGNSWDTVRFPYPNVLDTHDYAIEINDDSITPTFRSGDIIIVSPAAQTSRGDKVLVKTTEGIVLAKIILQQTATQVDLKALHPLHQDYFLAANQVDWISRIIWASQ